MRIIGIDTGLLGTIDAEQGAWLREVSQGPRPKILITGSPLYVDGEHHPCPIDGGGTVDDIVRDPGHHYVAAIGGDIHNYQRYPVDVDGRTIQYVVSGGGGAFMHATHTIPRVAVANVTEQDFRCYPLRGDSLAFYSTLYGRRLRLRRFFTLTEADAAAVIAERLGIPLTRSPGGPPASPSAPVWSPVSLGRVAAPTAPRGSGSRSARSTHSCSPPAPRPTARRSSSASCAWTSPRRRSDCAATRPRAIAARSWTRRSRTRSPSP